MQPLKHFGIRVDTKSKGEYIQTTGGLTWEERQELIKEHKRQLKHKLGETANPAERTQIRRDQRIANEMNIRNTVYQDNRRVTQNMNAIGYYPSQKSKKGKGQNMNEMRGWN